jgi:hypothetical protein
MPSTHPTATDLQALYASTGLVPNPAVAPFSSIAWAAYVATAIAAFAEATGRTFGVGTAAPSVARTFDPPRNSRALLQLGAEALSIASVTVSGAVQVLNTDYYLGPPNADAEGKPWSWIEFASPFSNPLTVAARKSVVVTGVWGYSVNVPDDVWDAELKYAGWLAAPLVALKISKGLSMLRGGDEERRFSQGRDAGPLATEAGMWLTEYTNIAALRKRVDVGL